MITKGLIYGGKLEYWHRHFLPILEVGTTQETEMPFRKGKCLVVRLPFTHPGYYVGVWYYKPVINHEDSEKIDQILIDAMKGRKAWEPEDGAYEEFFKE